MQDEQDFTINILANQIYQGSDVVSDGELTLTIALNNPSNLNINSTSASVTPVLACYLNASGQTLGQLDQNLASTTPTLDNNSDPPTITVPIQLNTLPSNTTAVVVNVTVAVNVSVPSGQTGSVAPTYSIVKQNPSSGSVPFVVEGSSPVSAPSAALQSATNYPSTYHVTPIVQQPSTGPANPTGDVTVTVPIHILNPPSSQTAFLQTTFTVSLSLGGLLS